MSWSTASSGGAHEGAEFPEAREPPVVRVLDRQPRCSVSKRSRSDSARSLRRDDDGRHEQWRHPLAVRRLVARASRGRTACIGARCRAPPDARWSATRARRRRDRRRREIAAQRAFAANLDGLVHHEDVVCQRWGLLRGERFRYGRRRTDSADVRAWWPQAWHRRPMLTRPREGETLCAFVRRACASVSGSGTAAGIAESITRHSAKHHRESMCRP